MSTYTAITIGPIYKTFVQARKSRELWGASYLFSFITREVIERLKSKWSILPLIPYYPDDIKEIDKQGAGFFSDHLIYEGNVVSKVKRVEKDIIKLVSGKGDIPLDYLENYLRITALKFDVPDKGKSDVPDGGNIVLQASKLLYTAELQEKYYQNINGINWRTAIDKLNGNMFYKKAFPGKSDYKFPSLIEIATYDIEKNSKDQYRNAQELLKENDGKEDEFIKELNDLIRPYHKYIAVIEADGDSIGETIGTIGSNVESVKKFSEALLKFSTAATQKIIEYGGKPIYSGGDDLLFFAPVAVLRRDPKSNKQCLKSIFSLVKDIDKVFNKEIIKNPSLSTLYTGNKKISKPTMSYGISVSYCKFPLNEARDTAHHLLFNEAKKDKDRKNKICFRLRKHSGQSLSFTVEKSNRITYVFLRNLLLNIALDKELISSVIYKLKLLSPLLKQIATDKERLYAFFSQEFEVDLYGTKLSDKGKFIKKIVDYYLQLSIDFPGDNKDLPKRETDEDLSNIGKLYSALRFMKHLISDDDE
jgi:CRISPR-associated protein Cmr2